ncbi:RNase P subunit p30 [Nitzschia inconspicua]|uniref:RNase P subunit p30 n=1 Tax=Nitzschia inconspicua TaxID=303405 RepID=A0A9K3LNP3_9STRA|nr:RNase P subunit p30 [Nitzschia inconspicua]
MTKRKKQPRKKLLRGSRGGRHRTVTADGNINNNCRCDLFVELPKSTTTTTSNTERHLIVNELRQRLQTIGYTHMALTHVIYGRPNAEQDTATRAIPTSLVVRNNQTAAIKSKPVSSSTSRKRKLDDYDDHDDDDNEVPSSSIDCSNDGKSQTIHVLRRLHSVVESVSDVATFTTTNETLQGYDLVSLGPTNDVTFQAACRDATAASIVTLDYTQRGLKLPFSIKSNDVQTLQGRGGSFEICMAPALLTLKHRKSLIHACREVLLACQQSSSSTTKTTKTTSSSPARILLSSGRRTNSVDGTDMGILALRTPGDLMNLAKVIMGFPDGIANTCMSTTPMYAIQHSKQQTVGGRETSIIASVDVRSRIQILQEGGIVSSTQKTVGSFLQRQDSDRIIGVSSTRAEESIGDGIKEIDDNYDDDDPSNKDEMDDDGFIAM